MVANRRSTSFPLPDPLTCISPVASSTSNKHKWPSLNFWRLLYYLYNLIDQFLSGDHLSQ